MKFRKLHILPSLLCLSLLFLQTQSTAQSISSDTLPDYPVEYKPGEQISWANISLTGKDMKPGGPFLPHITPGISWIPVLGGVIGAGALAVIILTDDKSSGDCEFTATAQVQSSTCGLPNGSVIVNVVPQGIYQFVWSNMNTAGSIHNIAEGNYTVTISREGTSCMHTLDVVVPNVNPEFNIATSIFDSECGLGNGTATIHVSPTGNYTYTWSNGGTGHEQVNLSPGPYTVTVSAGGMCNRVTQLFIEESIASIDITFIATASSCNQSTGSASVNVTPAGDYVYSWSNGSTGPEITNLLPGEYTVTVTLTGTSCAKEATVTIGTLSPDFEVTVNTTAATCGMSDGTASVVVFPEGTYQYLWSNGSTDASITDLSPGIYMLTVSSDESCFIVTEVNISELVTTFTLTTSSTPSECGQSTGTAQIIVNPAGEYVYLWLNGLTTSQVTGLQAGTYNVTVTVQGSSCSIDTSLVIEELPPSFALTTSSTPSACGQSTGTAEVTADPAGEYVYLWSNGLTTAQVTGLPAGIYQVTVTLQGTTCSKDTLVVITELPPSFTVQITTTPSGCTDSTGSATVLVEPKGNYTYQWSNGMSGSFIEGIPASNYTVTVTIDGSSCAMISMATVESTGVNFTGEITTEDADCGLTTGTATVSVMPEGMYTYLWSTEQTGPTASGLGAGEYAVSVTDEAGCSTSFSAIVGQEEASFIMITGSSPANCAGGGEVMFNLFTPGTGPLSLQVTGPAGETELILAQGSYALSTMMTVLPGTYTIVVFDQAIGNICTHMVDISIDDNTPVIQAMDDFYSITAGQIVNANALQNDLGLDLMMTMIENVTGGGVTFNVDGNFIFIPDQGFFGDASFTYTVTDACGATESALVVIEVLEGDCDFIIESTLIPASCGVDDGSISVEVLDAGTYVYEWDTGETGPVVTNLFVGLYTVTIEDVEQGCSLTFEFDLPELAADYISNIVVTQPTCETDAEITFQLQSTGMNALTMLVIHPNGNSSFSVVPGIVSLSDYISLGAGSYFIEINDLEAGPQCMESFEVDIEQVPMLELMLETVFPPSGPTAMDGAIIAVLTTPGMPPYMIFLNGFFYGMTVETLIVAEGVGFGEHTLQVIDNNGCSSNILLVNIPFQGIHFSLGTGIAQSLSQIPDDSENALSSNWNNALVATLQFPVGRKMHEVSFNHGFGNEVFSRQPSFLSIAYTADLLNTSFKKFNFKIQGGLGIYNPGTNPHPLHWNVTAAIERKIGKQILMNCDLSVVGWEKVNYPLLDVGIRMPLLSCIQYAGKE